MPNRANKPCGKSGCPQLANSRDIYCTKHRKETDEQTRAYDRARSSDETRKLYQTQRWRETRAIVLARDPLCKSCGKKPSTDADHFPHSARLIVSMLGNDAFFDPKRSVGRCHECHSARTRKEGE